MDGVLMKFVIAFAPLFSKPVFARVKVLLTGAILSPAEESFARKSSPSCQSDHATSAASTTRCVGLSAGASPQKSGCAGLKAFLNADSNTSVKLKVSLPTRKVSGCFFAITQAASAGIILATETYVFPEGVRQLFSIVPCGKSQTAKLSEVLRAFRRKPSSISRK